MAKRVMAAAKRESVSQRKHQWRNRVASAKKKHQWRNRNSESRSESNGEAASDGGIEMAINRTWRNISYEKYA